MDIEQLVSSINADMFQTLQRVVETGKWPDGRIADPAQREMLIQALMIWQSRNDGEREEPYTISSTGELRLACDSEKERLEAAFGDTFQIKVH